MRLSRDSEDRKFRNSERIVSIIPTRINFQTSQLPNFLLLAFCLLLAVPELALSQVRLPCLVSDGMVLQRGTNVRLWGWAKPGEEVTIRFLGKTYSTTTKADSGWSVMLSPMKAGGPYSMEIDASNHIVLNDIMVGDVWICSGQSNMWLQMEWIEPHYTNIIAHSYNPDIREFLVPALYDFNAPRKNLEGGEWVSVNPWSILHFSATGYFFARALWEKYHVPIGLINSSVGGTPIQSWLSAAVLKKFPAEQQTADAFKSKAYLDSVIANNDSVGNAWFSEVWSEDKGLNGKTPWYAPGYDDASWPTMNVPGYWYRTSLKNSNGVVWFRREFNVPASLAGKPAKLLLGRIVNMDYDYINGVLVGYTSYQYPERRYDVAAGLLKPGKNTIVVRVINKYGAGGFVQDKPYELKIGNHVIDLAGKWHYELGAAAKPMPFPTVIWYQPLGLFNGMIAPLLNYTIKGAIWYQGESNGGDPRGYFRMFSSMITDWRQKWGEGDFPFIFVQLPGFLKASTEPGPSGWAQVREDQLKTLSLPNTGMAVTIDIGEWNDVHPWDKLDVGRRLALAAEHVAFGENRIVYSGPIYKSMKVEGNKIAILFTNVGTGLMAKGGPLKRFEIAGKDGKYVWAKAKISGNRVIVWSGKVSQPTAVRYGWADNPAGANLFNKEGLPASPFETESTH